MGVKIVGVEDGALTVDVQLIAGSGGDDRGRYMEGYVAIGESEWRTLLRALVRDEVMGLQVRVDITTLAAGFANVCGPDPDKADLHEAEALARYLRRNAERLDGWVKALRERVPEED